MNFMFFLLELGRPGKSPDGFIVSSLSEESFIHDVPDPTERSAGCREPLQPPRTPNVYAELADVSVRWASKES